MKICVIGNSHTAAIKLAYDDLRAEYPNIEMTFFAGRGPSVERLCVDGRVLKPRKNDTKFQYAITITSGGLSEIIPGDYDRFLLIGLSVEAGRLVSTTTRPISRAARNCAIQDYWQASQMANVVKNLRRLTDKPVTAGFTPMLAEEKKNETGVEGYLKLVSLSNELFFQNTSATLLGQPIETIVNGTNTLFELSRNSEELLKDKNDIAVLHPEGEKSHMNRHYGALWLRQYFGTLG